MSHLQPRRRRIGPLEAFEIEGSPDGPTVVLFHGYGADASDLVPLAQALRGPKGTNWIFPNGHLTVPLGGHFEGRAWFPISVAQLERVSAGVTRDATSASGVTFDAGTPPGLKRARENALEMLERLGRPWQRLVLGGFSQGAMLATDVVVHSDSAPAGLAILSGTLVHRAVWKELARRHAGFEFFQSHGFHDPVLSYELARQLESLLLESGWKGRLQRFEGGHEIPPEVVIQLGQYVRKALS